MLFYAYSTVVSSEECKDLASDIQFQEQCGRVGTASADVLKMFLGTQTKSHVWNISVYCL